MRTRTTQEQRDALRQFIVDRVIAHAPEPFATLPDGERWNEVAQVLIDCNDAIARVESIERQLFTARDSVSAAERNLGSLILEVVR